MRNRSTERGAVADCAGTKADCKTHACAEDCKMTLLRCALDVKRGTTFSPFPSLVVLLLKSVLLLELVYASACVYQLLLTRKVRMAFVADFYLDRIGILCSTGLKGCATSTYNCRFVIIRMYTLFHFALPRLLYFRGQTPIRACTLYYRNDV